MTDSTPTTAATDPLCGCRIERDEDGDYVHCNGKGVHYPNEVTVDV